MDTVFANCAGLDVHKKFVVACHLWRAPDGQVHKEIRRFGTMTADLEALAAWLVTGGCTHVVLESTGVMTPPTMLLTELWCSSFPLRSRVIACGVT